MTGNVYVRIFLIMQVNLNKKPRGCAMGFQINTPYFDM